MKDSSEFQQLLDKYIDTDRINHAYLIETNCHDRLSIAHQLIEKILDLKNKNIINLKNSIKTKSLYTGYRVYIIEEAEKINMSSANTLLKFLEEPDDNIIAVLITNNRYNVIETILSRCQIIRYYNKDEESNIELPDNYEQLVNFVKSVEDNKEAAIGEEGIYQVFGHTQLKKPLINEKWACLDCRKGFIIDTLTWEITEEKDFYES